MLTLQNICLQTVQILALIFGILGMSVSFFLVFAPNLIKSASYIFNRNVSVDEKIGSIDKEVNIDSFFYSNNKVVGACILFGSLFALSFLFLKLDIDHLAHLFSGSYEEASINAMIFNTISWVGEIACFIGLIFGIMLFFYPEKMKRIDIKLSSSLHTQPIVDKLNSCVYEFDSILLHYPRIFGISGLVLSIFIVILSTLNLLN